MINHQSTRKPCPSAANTGSRAKTNNKAKFITATREAIGFILAAAIFVASVLTSAFGMSGGFAPTLEAGYTLAGVGTHGR